MKRTYKLNILFSIITLLSLSSFTANSPTVWTNDLPHSQLFFTVTHLGINDVSGTFDDITVQVKSSKKDFSDAVFTLTAKQIQLTHVLKHETIT
ncbi:YceI family protein [Plebeiibacterium sediminum]|uniref:Lipid/polyisoprenoid-binding YceI-like domain-containing protein n=1 Tax=Plebeiibacterium sediminum TaxID=2992112 RepID=A0AAE3SHI2_9BACT|nr:YceI family protein [Plebeiobacterium sediminum]MCW3789436.1 hypothetical protein [Plebeiobacterium sediminum]